jgi:predicted RNA-binding Zn ribbon-like protein
MGVTCSTSDGVTLAHFAITGQGGAVIFEFIADRPALDFVATVAERGTNNVDSVRSPADLVDWVRQSGIIDRDLRATEADLKRAKVLREALFALVAALINGSPPQDLDRKIVNAAAGWPRPLLELDTFGHVRRSGGLNAVLAVLATDVIDLYSSPDRGLIRWCDDARCTRPFVDRSRGHRRRWCGMQGCGDRAKAAAYRQRQRAASN